MSTIYIYPKLRTLFLDENISVMDKEHIENINIIYDFLKKNKNSYVNNKN
jgi:ABC-type hemin transport system ATPase subunit